MLLAVDVYYRESGAQVSGVVFRHWPDAKPERIYHCAVDTVRDYEPGKFYLRELPCILHLLDTHDLAPDTIIIDGYVYLGDPCRPGLGMHLYNHLQGRVPVIGVAKSRFRGTPADAEISRGRSSRPLFVTSVGVELETAKRNILAMHGRHRLPDLLRIADRACRAGMVSKPDAG